MRVSFGSACSALNCSNNRGKNPDLHFFRFPKDTERCRKWIMNTHRDIKVSEVKYCFLCSLHFETSQFVNSERKKLNWNAIPTIFDIPDVPLLIRVKRRFALMTQERLTTSPIRKKIQRLCPHVHLPKNTTGNDSAAHPATSNKTSTTRTEVVFYDPLASHPEESPDKWTITSISPLNKQGLKSIKQPQITCVPLERKKAAIGIVTEDIDTGVVKYLDACAAVQCKSHKESSPHLKFHRFPTNKARAIKWAINSGRPDLINSVSKEFRIDNDVLCSLHFESHCYRNHLKTTLTQFAIPTIFHTRKDNVETNPSSQFADLVRPTTDPLASVEKEEQLNVNTTKILHQTAIDSSKNIAKTVDQNKTTEEVRDNDQVIFISGDVNCSAPTIPLSAQTEIPRKEMSFLIDGVTSSNKHLLCRLCATFGDNSEMIHIFGKIGASKEYLRKINQLLPFAEQVTENDYLPQWICNYCSKRLDYCDQAVQDFVAASGKLKCLFHESLAIKKHKVPRNVTHESMLTVPQSQLTPKPVANNIVKTELIIDDSQDNSEEWLHFSRKGSQNLGVSDFTKNLITSSNSTSSQEEGIAQPISITTSISADNSRKYHHSQCENMFSDNSTIVHHELTKRTLSNVTNTNATKSEVKAIRKAQMIDAHLSLESQAYVPDSSELEDIKTPVKRRAQNSDNQIKPTLMPTPSPKLVRTVSIVNNAQGSKISATNEENSFSCTKLLWQNKLNQPNGPCQEPVIQDSHTIIPTSGNKSFLCHVCNSYFSSIESVLSHRFKEHSEEEILQGRPL